MARLSTVLGAAAFLLLQVATCDNIIIARLDDLSGSPRPDGSIIDRAIRDEGVAEWANIVPRENGLVPGEVAVVGDKKYIASQGVNQAAQLDGRALLAEWMQPRGLSKRACVNAGWQSCNSTSLSPSFPVFLHLALATILILSRRLLLRSSRFLLSGFYLLQARRHRHLLRQYGHLQCWLRLQHALPVRRDRRDMLPQRTLLRGGSKMLCLGRLCTRRWRVLFQWPHLRYGQHLCCQC